MTSDARSDETTVSQISTPAGATEGADAKLARFREKLDAYRIRARASQERLAARTSAFCSFSADSAIQEPRPAAGAADQEFGALLALAPPEDPAWSAGDEKSETLVDREWFEIVMPPEPPAFQFSMPTLSRQFAYGALAAGLAVAAVLGSVSVVAERDDEAVASADLASSGAGAHRHAGLDDDVARGEFATASIDEAAARRSRYGYLGAAELAELLRDRPVKCVLDAPISGGVGAGAAVDADALRLAASVAHGCVETIAYEPASSLLVREASAPGGGRIEINAAFSIEGDAICHQTRGMSALVLGDDMPEEGARSLENLLNASYADLRGSPICHRLQSLGDAPGGPLFRADAYVDGARVVERTDPRPFVMMRRLDRAGL